MIDSVVEVAPVEAIVEVGFGFEGLGMGAGVLVERERGSGSVTRSFSQAAEGRCRLDFDDGIVRHPRPFYVRP